MGAKQGRPGNRSAGGPPAASRSSAQRQQATKRALATARGGRWGRGRLWITVVPVAWVLVLIALLVTVKVTSTSATASGVPAGAAPASVVNAVAGVPAATLNTIGAGSAGQKPFNSLPTTVSGGAALTSAGLPQVLYVGAEYCPYCAAERWAVAVALSHFGTLHSVGTTASSPSDVYPNTASLSFHGTTFSSSVVAFNGYELFSNQAQGSGFATLDTLSSADNALFQSAGGSFPFVDIGGQYVISGATFSPQLLAGLSVNQIAAALSDPTSAVAKAIDGSANVITAAICATTGQQPAAVCTSPGVVAGQAKLGG